VCSIIHKKNGFEYGLYPNTTILYENINHSSEGITLSLYQSKFFVENVVKRNIMNNQGKSKYTEPNQYPLIYTYPRKIRYKFEEIYIVPSSTNKNKKHKNNNNTTIWKTTEWMTGKNNNDNNGDNDPYYEHNNDNNHDNY
jgi:hypothetical protein